MDDQQIVQRILEGDAQAFELIINRYEKSIVRFIYQMIKNKETAEDLTQEVFIMAYNKLYSYRQEYKFSTWLYSIARNKTIDFIRKDSKVKNISIDELGPITSKESSPEEKAEFKEFKKAIESFIETLDIVDKQILTLRYSREELTFNDIADMLDMSLSSVKKRYYKIYDRFENYYSSRNLRKRGEVRELRRIPR